MRRTLSNVGSTATHSTEPVCPTYLLIASFVLLVVSTYVRTRIQSEVRIGLVRGHALICWSTFQWNREKSCEAVTKDALSAVAVWYDRSDEKIQSSVISRVAGRQVGGRTL